LVQVEDSGPGIGESERDLVFQPFYRTLGTDADGTGLGLAIVQEIARRHGGEVRLDDTEPRRNPPGARFTVRFEARKDSGSVPVSGMVSSSSPPAPSLGPLL
jgi:two-component system sensor histidine kinase TctE